MKNVLEEFKENFTLNEKCFIIYSLFVVLMIYLCAIASILDVIIDVKMFDGTFKIMLVIMLISVLNWTVWFSINIITEG